MRARSVGDRLIRLAMVPFLVAAVGVAAAQGPQGRNDDRGQNRGDPHGMQNQDRRPGDQGNDFHFRDQDRQAFQSHYGKDVDKWRKHQDRRPQFSRGQRIPDNYRLQVVPQSYYRTAPPPPPGYRYGYYNGYVVAYNPTTRIIADVLDLVGAVASH